jgi:hypothetical protein
MKGCPDATRHPERTEGPHKFMKGYASVPCVINQLMRGPSPSARLGMTPLLGSFHQHRFEIRLYLRHRRLVG